jgi:hypothetical protein
MAVFSVLWVANASAETTIGTTTGSLVGCGASLGLLQSAVASPGLSFTVPSGDWVLNSWSTQANSGGGQMAAVIYRQTSPGVYTVVGTSALETLTPNVLNTFSTAIQVQPGDLLGFWATAPAACAVDTGNSGDVLSYWFASSQLAVGATTTSGSWSNDPQLALDISATLAPASTSPSHMFVCYSKWEQDGGAVIETDQAEQLLASGWWLPTALPGNVVDGDNLGAYHLECNPPDSLESTGEWVDGGGTVLNTPGTGIGWYAIKTAA